MIRSRTFGGVKQVTALVTWVEIEAIAAEVKDPGQQISYIKIVIGKPDTLADLTSPAKREKLIGEPLAHYSAPNRLIQRLTEDEWQKILDPRLGKVDTIQRPWQNDFILLPFGEPGATKVVANIEAAWREIKHDGISYRSMPGDYADYSYRLIENMVC